MRSNDNVGEVDLDYYEYGPKGCYASMDLLSPNGPAAMFCEVKTALASEQPLSL